MKIQAQEECSLVRLPGLVHHGDREPASATESGIERAAKRAINCFVNEHELGDRWRQNAGCFSSPTPAVN